MHAAEITPMLQKSSTLWSSAQILLLDMLRRLINCHIIIIIIIIIITATSFSLIGPMHRSYFRLG